MIMIPIIGVIGIIISSVILLGIAKVLGGKGNLVSQTYVLAAIQAPMTIILIPLRTTVNGLSDTPFEVIGLITGLIILFPLAIYSGWLSIVALRATHAYSGGLALLTVVIFGALIFGFGCALVMLFGLILSLLA